MVGMIQIPEIHGNHVVRRITTAPYGFQHQREVLTILKLFAKASDMLVWVSMVIHTVLYTEAVLPTAPIAMIVSLAIV